MKGKAPVINLHCLPSGFMMSIAGFVLVVISHDREKNLYESALILFEAVT